MFWKKIKIIGEEPKNKDKIILLISILLVFLAWIFIGLILYQTNQQVATPLFTLILATITVMATFQNEIKSWWKRPIIELIPHAEHSIKKTIGAWYFRIKVKNLGRGCSKKSQIRLIQGFDLNNTESITDPINFRWAGAINEAGYEKHLEKKDIPAYSRDFFDLLIIERVLNDKWKILLNSLAGRELENFKKVFEDMPLNEKFIPNKYRMYLIGSNGEKRKLELGGPDYLIYVTFYAEGDYSKEFSFKINNSENPDNVKLESWVDEEISNS